MYRNEAIKETGTKAKGQLQNRRKVEGRGIEAEKGLQREAQEGRRQTEANE